MGGVIRMLIGGRRYTGESERMVQRGKRYEAGLGTSFIW